MNELVGFRFTTGSQGVTQERVSIGAEISDRVFPFEIGRADLAFAQRYAEGRPIDEYLFTKQILGRSRGALAARLPSYAAGDAQSSETVWQAECDYRKKN